MGSEDNYFDRCLKAFVLDLKRRKTSFRQYNFFDWNRFGRSEAQVKTKENWVLVFLFLLRSIRARPKLH